MFDRIIVALDGTERAEEGITYAAEQARAATGADAADPTAGVLLLARVVQPTRNPRNPLLLAREWFNRLLQPPPPTAHRPVDAADATVMAEAQRYLDRQALALRLRGQRAETFVRWGDPGEQLATLAEDERARLIVCGIDQGDEERPGYGAGAAAILRWAPVPVLLVRRPRPRQADPAARFPGERPGNPRLRRGR
ncbi:MAG TPA: universal stress protein [Thermomicrobiales bacterium]|nr:universal stress protein [Thermomicrobiales bacterium]